MKLFSKHKKEKEEEVKPEVLSEPSVVNPEETSEPEKKEEEVKEETKKPENEGIRDTDFKTKLRMGNLTKADLFKMNNHIK